MHTFFLNLHYLEASYSYPNSSSELEEMKVFRILEDNIVMVGVQERKNLMKSFYHSDQVIIVLLMH